jgi:hypothetical protein
LVFQEVFVTSLAVVTGAANGIGRGVAARLRGRAAVSAVPMLKMGTGAPPDYGRDHPCTTMEAP